MGITGSKTVTTKTLWKWRADGCIASNRFKLADVMRLHTTPLRYRVKAITLITQRKTTSSTIDYLVTLYDNVGYSILGTPRMQYLLFVIGAFILLLIVNAFFGGDPLG